MAQLVTKKRGTIITMPDLRTTIYQPNRVTNASYNYTLLQERILNYVMSYLQGPIKDIWNGKGIHQLEMFQTNEIKITVHLDTIVSNNRQYKKLRQEAAKMATIPITMKGRGDQGEIVERFMGLFSEVRVPQDMKRTSLLYIYIKADVAKWLVHLDRNTYNKPCQWTSFTLEVANTTKNKYTSRLYKMACSYKEKGGFHLTMEELRYRLQLDDTYQNFKDIRRRILAPAIAELKEKADCWFECADDKMVKDGKKVIALWFKVIEPETERLDEIKRKNIQYLLTSLFKFKDHHLAQIEPIFKNDPDFGLIAHKIHKLNERISENKHYYKYAPNYVITALIGEFAPK